MKTFLLKKLYAILIVSTLCTVTVNAQIVYTDLKPDKKFTCSQVGCSHMYKLDLNNDGITDFTLTAEKNANTPLCIPYKNKVYCDVSITSLDSNEVMVTNPLLLMKSLMTKVYTVLMW